jgi:DNA-binding transcriptional LysR family regulator
MFRGSMNVDIQDLVLIEEIDKAGSFSGAANSLFRTRSAITQHVQKLEDHLGFLIFDRSYYRPILTPEGKLFLERGRPFLRGFQRFKSEIQHIQQGWESEFSIAVDDVIGVEKIYFLIEEFRHIAPQITIRLLREVLNGCWDALTHNRADLAIGASGEPPLELVCQQEPLGSIDFVYAVAKDHPLTQIERPVTPEDLTAYPMIIISDTSVDTVKRTSGIVSQQPKIIVQTMDDKIAAQVKGLGVGYVPLPRVQYLIDQELLVKIDLVHHTKKKGEFKIAWVNQPESRTLNWFLEALSREEVKELIIGENAN